MQRISSMRHAYLVVLLSLPACLQATVFTIDTTADTGAGSLREAITSLAAGSNTIQFDIPTTDPGYDAGTNTWTIAPATVLPTIAHQVTINGYSFIGAVYNTATPNNLGIGDDANLQIILNGSGNSVGDPTYDGSGLHFIAGSDGSVVQGLVINEWAASGIFVDGSDGAIDGISINGNFIGTDSTGTTVLANRAGISFIGIVNPCTGLSVGTPSFADRNIIAGSYAPKLFDFDGLTYVGSGAIVSNTNTGTTIVNNYIGTDASGTVALGNSAYGILFVSETGSTIGGADSLYGNIVSGQTLFGIRIAGSTNITIQNNLVGTDVTGSFGIGNLNAGIEFDNDNFTSTGGSLVSNNVISGNGTGIRVGEWFYPGVNNIIVQNNKIGTNKTGRNAVSNLRFGVEICDSDNTVTGNIISGNIGGGVLIYSNLSFGELVTANNIGTDISGTRYIPNNGNGVQIGIQGAFAGFCTDNTIGS